MCIFFFYCKSGNNNYIDGAYIVRSRNNCCLHAIKLTSKSSSKLISYMKRTNFTTLGEFVHFDENGDPIASYDLMNWQGASDGLLQLVKVGFYDASLKEDSGLVINESMIMWQRDNKVCAISSITRSSFIRLFIIQFFCIIVIQIEDMFCILKWHNTVHSVDFTLGILISLHQLNMFNISFYKYM